MKQLELELKKRLLIVEGLNLEDFNPDLKMSHFYKGNEIKLICKGDELTEEAAKGLVENAFDSFDVCWFKDYEVLDTSIHDDYTFLTAIESFISAIESKGYFWGENPITEPKKPPFLNPNKNGHCENDYVDYRYDLYQFHEAESRTFNPEKTLIFEIL